ncbi:putative mismatch repair protein [Leishmania major strain Friedlin]|uniref:Putative mismatch repair protein n=1 Tax=Leishmania major TaxID=5664 RepID=Q4QAI9_LEIMA|nr:putative mismatch repair protein [Leishmania major strain Friedlin]CAG9574614.1 mismatch_repair_protein_-_putative [Leishmania major strain Friedlin]CAJ05022.1 putative mismatch repair protein [Leishmania major strain Friedlin]|eukprot:XP_001683659.1 putative mismatch repair protein [Leishmania major strain Friedlin]
MGSIHKLTDDVINRIAAGEVVQRPSAALKELLENAIDAGCSRVQVVAAEGGLEVLQVCDDGSGIHKEDLPLLCERYATSKLQTFEDLHRVTSFGFRGEALASISYVSRMTVTTRRRQTCDESGNGASGAGSCSFSTAGAAVAWRCQYLNGTLLEDPQPCAGNPGTTVRVEKLFYNALVRRRSLRASEEWGRIVDVVSRYALAFPAIGFTCCRDRAYGCASGGGGSSTGSLSRLGGGGNGSNSAGAPANPGGSAAGGLCFPPRSNTRQNIRLSHGTQLASHLRLVYAYNVETATALSCGAEPDTDSEPLASEVEAEDGALSAGDEPGQLPTSSSASSSTQALPSTLSTASRQSAAREARVFAQMEQRARRVRATCGSAGEGLFTLVGYTSDPTLAQRKPYLCVFINQRLVESAAIRKAIDAVYSGVLTGGHRPFTVLLLSVPTDRVDVNVHPTKKEVCLLDEELIVSRVAEVCRGAVLEAAAARQMDMLKMRHTAALVLRQQLPSADGVGAADNSATAELSGSSIQHILEKLREQHQRGAPLASPLTSSSLTSTAAVAPAGAGVGGVGPNVVVAPCTMVRVEPQKGALDKYFSQRLAAAAAPAAATALAPTSSPSSLSSSRTAQEILSRDSVPDQLRAEAEEPLKDGDRRQESAIQRAKKGDATNGQSQTTAAYEAPSWEAVMASLHGQRAPATSTTTAAADDDSHGFPFASPLRKEICSGESNDMATHAVQTSREAVDNGGEGNAGLAVPHVLQVTMERTARRGAGGADSAKARAALLDEESADGCDNDEDEDDGMREFKRHRREVHERAQLLQRVTGGAAAAAAMDEAAVEHDASSAAILCPRDHVRPSSAAEVEKAQLAVVHLGAVVRASDMLRSEAAAADASHFSYTVVSCEDSNMDEEKSQADASTNGAPAGVMASLVDVAEVPAPALLSSVSMIVDRLLAEASPTADNLVDQLSFVGTVDSRAFLAQAGTTLLWCDTMALTRHVVFQRIFLRWCQPALPAPPVLAFATPVRLADLLLLALAYDGPHLQPPSATLLAVVEECAKKRQQQQAVVAGGGAAQLATSSLTTDAVRQTGGATARAWREVLFNADMESKTLSPNDLHTESGAGGVFAGSESVLPQPEDATMRYVRRLVRRLCRWRGLLKEYFYIDITADGLLVGLPYGLNRHWPPRMRAVPVMVWLLAEAVPYPGTAAPSSSTMSGAADQTGPTSAAWQSNEGRGAEEVVACVATSTSPATSLAPTQTEATPTTTPQPTAMEAEADGVAQEVACFTAVARHIAETLYGLPPPPPSTPPTSAEGPDTATADVAAGATDTASAELWREELVRHGLFACLKNPQLCRLPDQCLRDGTIQSLVSVESLYKVFERC